MTSPGTWTPTGQPQTKKSRTVWVIIGAVIGGMVLMFAAVLGIGWYGVDGPGAPDEVQVYRDNGPEICETAVLPKLKSPASAVFTWEEPREDTASIPKRDRYLMDGYVDSQNGFGAVLRTSIVCSLTLNDDDTMSATATLRK